MEVWLCLDNDSIHPDGEQAGPDPFVQVLQQLLSPGESDAGRRVDQEVPE